MDSAVGDASPHIANMGRMIEVKNAFVNYKFCMYVSCNILMWSKYKSINVFLFPKDMENKMRNTLNDIYFGKTRDIVNALRWVLNFFLSIYSSIMHTFVPQKKFSK